MGETARLSDPHVPLGRAPGPVVLAVWPQQTSRVIVVELILTGGEVGAKEAVSLCLANPTVPDGTARAEALALARTIAALPPYGIAWSKPRDPPDDGRSRLALSSKLSHQPTGSG